MDLLNELVESLYSQCMAETAPSDIVAEATVQDPTVACNDATTERIRRVLTEMGELLSEADQPRLDEQPPTPLICQRILNHWDQFTASVQGIREHLSNLEHDIERMQPWGDFDVMKVEQLEAHGIHIGFWRTPISQLPEDSDEELIVKYQVRIISHDALYVYFVTINTEGETVILPQQAQHIDICPCPVSTLIMLQTRQKDSLRSLQTLREDYALAHYGEMYAALRQVLPPGTPLPQLKAERKGLRQKIRQFFANANPSSK